MGKTLIVGKITGAHGIRGEVKVYPLTDDPERFNYLDKIMLNISDNKKFFNIERIKYQNTNIILKLKEINDRNTAETLKNKFIEIDRNEGIPLEENQYYIIDLIGLKVIDEDNNTIGELIDVIQTGSTDIYTVKTEKKDILIPAIKENILSVNIDEGYLKAKISEGLKNL